METPMNSSTASEASAVVSNVITEPVNPTARTIYSVVTAQPVIEGAPEQVSHVSRGNRRASKRMRRSRKRSRAQQKDAEAEAASYKRHTHVKTYKDKMRNFRKNVVRCHRKTRKRRRWRRQRQGISKERFAKETNQQLLFNFLGHSILIRS